MLERLPLPIATLVVVAIGLFVIGIVALPFYLMYQNRTALLVQDQNINHPFIAKLAKFNHIVGTYCCWMILWMSLIQFILVVMRYVFSYGSLPLQESVIYLHGMLFLLVAGYTYLNDGHVRVDIFYNKMTERRSAMVNLFGVLFLLLPVLLTTWFYSYSYVLNSWAVMETSPEGSGLPFLYLLKTTIWVFVLFMLIESAVVVAKNVVILRNLKS